ncbi:MAG TPA: right-handed parallel beta-helix repeat-containing protein [Pyrinomonadaceae bacterium]|nr:right-handed parallel beta-helix repeat-containing protein [Pyrinomonadaceae bacterium]
MHSRILTTGKFLLPALALTVLALANAPTALANHTVYLEGNCAGSPTTSALHTAGACGDYDNDGVTGTTEDGDGDNVFGTLNGALAAVAGNGRIVIVTSGVFTQTVNGATNAAINVSLGTGNVQIEAANGVDATIDAVVPGDTTNNTFRQQAIGLLITGASGSSVTLRNLTVRNWMIGMRLGGAVRVKVEGCHFDNNRDYGIQLGGTSRITVNDSEIAHTGHRQGGDPNPNPGTGIQFLDQSGGYLYDTVIADSTGFGIHNVTAAPVTICHVVLHDNVAGNTGGSVNQVNC